MAIQQQQKARLKVNIISEGKLLLMDSVVDIQQIPVRLRKPRYCEEYVPENNGREKFLKRVKEREEQD